MSGERLLSRALFALYMALFFLYLFAPLAVMGAAAFNASRFPTVAPWQGFTTSWFSAMIADHAMWRALWASILIGAGVVLVSVPVGAAAALVLDSLNRRARGIAYAVMVSPLLMPGVVIGIASLVFWRRFGLGGGHVLIVLAQSSFIIAFVMLLVAARMERFDRMQEEAALDLGATKAQVFRRVILPYLRPALLSGVGIAFLQSFENYNTTLFVRGVETPLTVYIATKVRTGLTPAVNALGLVLIVVTICVAAALEILRRRNAAKGETT